MNAVLSTACRLLLAAALLMPVATRADPVTLFVPFEGAGNVSVFDPVAGTGGWTGRIEQSPFPAVPLPLSLVSVVLFTFDAATQTLSGSFEFTTAADLASTLFGAVTGSTVDPDVLTDGGQFSIDYSIAGGSGMFAGATGYGLSFVDFDPAGRFDNYSEAGTLLVTVPEPGTVMLALTCLALLAAQRLGACRPCPQGASELVGSRRKAQPWLGLWRAFATTSRRVLACKAGMDESLPDSPARAGASRRHGARAGV